MNKGTAWVEVCHRCPCPLFRPGDETNFVVEVPEAVNDMFAEGREDKEAVGFGRCPNCGEWISLYTDAQGDCADPSGHHVGKWALTVPLPGRPYGVGSWVKTERWGPAVVTGIAPDGGVRIRYEALRFWDNATIWVANTENPWEVTWLKDPDAVSLQVLTLTGPYGVEDE